MSLLFLTTLTKVAPFAVAFPALPVHDRRLSYLKASLSQKRPEIQYAAPSRVPSFRLQRRQGVEFLSLPSPGVPLSGYLTRRYMT